ncbi:serine hydrolase domain-containing protein [Roseisolibacter sp. H3M3-2]|uniref:serine hydrolase domain-containing protein n=1 Tax=Roseisolibacter sp. H3M3-2 TaxID=3031323 RepID=UPI0023DCA921|nr:serine hydrolase domain-containing protein [Roseisolibacter sp. H3M3-2]MDF1503437.1 serine hydrolase [Roseisolibacter sp. H3M3-2]
MRRFPLLAAAAAVPALASAQPAAFAARVDSLFDRWRGTDRPGCAVGVSDRGRVVLERAYGMADLESGVAMAPATVVHAASLAKSVTALAVLLLEQEGRLSLDDPARRHLPDLPASAGDATIRQLLTHTAGLRDVFELAILARGRFEEDRITQADALAMLARQRAPNFAPGAEYGYSNTGYLLAARIVERISGRPFAAFAAERLFAPLGMRRTHVRDDVAALVPGRAVGYARRGAGWRVSTPNFDVVGSTNLQTTVGDLLRWADNLDRPAVGDTALVRRMQTPAVLSTGDTTTYGLGLSLVRDRGWRVAEHEGRDPGFRAYLGRWLDRGVSVALLCNAAALDPVGLGRTVASLYLGPGPAATPGAAAASGDAPGDARAALAWAGVYFEPTTRQVAELTVRDGVLYTDRSGGARFEAHGPRRARQVGVPLELDFGAGARPGYRVRWLVPGRRADAFAWRAPAAPALDRRALAAYAGTYASAELDATYRVEAGDSTLTLRAGAAPGLVARPVFPDGFVSGQYTVEFARTGGRVTGFAISHPRARGVAFVRVLSR